MRRILESIISTLDRFFIKLCFKESQITVGELYSISNPETTKIYNNDQLKFIGKGQLDDTYVTTPTGISKVKNVFKTVPYEIYELTLSSGKILKCADTHIVVTNNGQKFVKDLDIANDLVQTIDGFEIIRSCCNTLVTDNMYDIEIDDIEHLYYTNGIVSHNTECISAYILWFSLFNPDKTIIIASNKSDNAMEIIAKIQNAYEELPHWLKPGIDESSWNKHTCAFDNKSRILSQTTAEDTGRGFAVSLLYCDEFAHVKPHIQEAFWTSIFPVLSTGGNCIISSTPNGSDDKFAELWRQAELNANTFHPFTVEWNARPGRDDKFKEEVIANFGMTHWLQEYCCHFISSDHILVDYQMVLEREKALKTIVPVFTLHNPDKKEDQPFFKKIDRDGTYLVGVDPGTGSGNDYTAIEVFEFPSMEHVMEYRTNSLATPEIYNYLKKVLKFLEHFAKEVYFSIENNGVGQGIITLYQADEHPPEKSHFLSDSAQKNPGMFTTDKNKMEACILLKNMFESNLLTFYSPIILRELKHYKRDKGAYAAKTGSTDDCISATLVVLKMLKEISQFDERAYHKLYTINLKNRGEDWVEEVYREQEQGWNEPQYDEDDVPLPIIIT